MRDLEFGFKLHVHRDVQYLFYYSVLPTHDPNRIVNQ